MRFNTLTLDANLPTTQQVNVPTNTDYKVGMKVKRNGEVQQLGPDEITIYTGETTPGEPETATLEKTFDPGYYTVGDDGLLLYDNFGEIEPEKIYPIITNATATVGGQTLQINTDDIIMSLDSPDGHWTPYEVDGKIVWKNGSTSETRDYMETAGYDLMIELPKDKYTANGFTTTLEQSAQDNGYSGSATIVTKPAEDVPVTIPTDADKTNGYVTFTQASNDDASFRQLKVAVAVPEVPETVVKEAKNVVNTTGSRLTKQGVEISMEDHPELLGKAITPLNIIYNTAAGNGTTPPDLDTLEAEAVNVWSDANPVYNTVTVAVLINGDQMTVGDYYLVPPPASFRPNFIAQGAPADKPFFVKYELGSTGWYLAGYEAEHILVEGDIVYPVRNNINNNTSRGFVLKLMMGDAVPAWGANFKLNVNEFKSQCGDLNAQTDPDFSTAKVEGTYADGTEFSFDFCIQ